MFTQFRHFLLGMVLLSFALTSLKLEAKHKKFKQFKLQEQSSSLKGRVFKKFPGDYGDSLKVYIYSDKGKLLATTYTDSLGKFDFPDLKIVGNYFFEVESADDNYQLVTLDSQSKVIHRMVRNEFGQFTYSRLKHDKQKVRLIESKDREAIVYLPNEDREIPTFTLHYRLNEYVLEKPELERFEVFLKALKTTNGTIQLTSYTDSNGSASYNTQLSKRRSSFVKNYLIENGIEEYRIKVDYKGEQMPIIDCEKKDCTKEEERLNRRTEIKILQGKN